MLVLSRKPGQRIKIGGCIWLTILECRDGRVRVGVEAPGEVTIVREELLIKETPDTKAGDNTEGSPRD
jgi:carbon storage regulator